MDPLYCVITSLALWLETFFIGDNPTTALPPYVFGFSDDIQVPRGGGKAKDTVQDIFGKEVFKQEEFTDNAGPLGSHSVGKYASTHVCRSDINKDKKDIRERWKRKGRVSDVYDDVELPYPDVKVADKLCVGGPCN
jgi:hypothetical protein